MSVREQQGASTGAEAGGPAVVLVVDDDPVIRALVAHVLESEGHEVAQAADGAAALRWLEVRRRLDARSPDAIVLDLRMPVMDGWAFANAYHHGPGPHAPIVVITAASDAVANAAGVGAVEVLPKPFDVERLLAAIERCARQTR